MRFHTRKTHHQKGNKMLFLKMGQASLKGQVKEF